MNEAKTAGDALDERVQRPESVGFLPRGRGASIAIALAAVATTAVLLLMPVPQGRHHRIIAAILDLGHVPLFAALAWGAIAILGARWWVAVGLALIVVGGEFIQYLSPGRMPDRKDMLHGLIGVAIAWGIAWGWTRGRRMRAAVLTAAALVLCIPLINIVPDILDVLAGKRQFPVLCTFQTPWEDRRFDTHQGNVRTLRDEASRRIGRIDFFAGHRDDFPGVEFIPVVTDWSRYQRLAIEFTADAPIELCWTIRDQPRRQASYHERFNFSRPFEPGRHRVTLSLEEIRTSPRDGPLDLTQIDSINFFIPVAGAPNHIWVHAVELE